MVNFNQVVLAGNLTRDPELRYVPSGKAVAKFGLAVNRSYVTQSGEKKEEVSFIPIVVWGKQAEFCNQYLHKGRPVLIAGRLQSRSWETETGDKRSILEVVAQQVQFLDRREEFYEPQERFEEPPIDEKEEVDEVPF
ncbi:MAG: single-stranded DNA-binding protein [bacterium]|nr:single-stranded DNA-binding protein [bacterium]